MSGLPTKAETITAIREVAAAVDAGVDPFTLLRISPDADPAQIRDAYFRLVRLVQPNSLWIIGNPELDVLARRAVQAVMAAHAALSDAERRHAYRVSFSDPSPVPVPRGSADTTKSDA